MISLVSKLKSLLLMGGILLVLSSTLLPNFLQFISNADEEAQTRDLIETYEKLLDQPMPPNLYLENEAFLSGLETEGDRLAFIAATQAQLIEKVRAHRARLIDLSEVGDETSVQGLNGLSFQLQYEGDLQAVLDVINSMSELEPAILIERMDIKAIGPANRPDMRLSVSLNLIRWHRVSL